MRLSPGHIVSHYRIIDVLGEGGMGIVYRAQDLKLPREVALKFLPDNLLRDAIARKRFIGEARAASSLNHPNICTIHDIDETADGRTFIVMPCYKGETLRARLERAGVLDPSEAVRIASQLADGLSRAHARDILHRDVKPENIFITDDETAVLMDFGLARLVDDTRVTKTGQTLGTVAYMAPEQASGGHLDHRCDIFSLGVVLYEMLTGHRPFTGEHPQAVLYAILNHEPAPLSAHRPELSADLRRIVDLALMKKPEDRYASVVHFRDDLRNNSAAVSSLRTGPHAHPRRWRDIALLSAVLIVGAVAVLIWHPWTHVTGEEKENQALAIVGFQDVSNANDQLTSSGITELVNVGLTEASPVRLVSTEYLQDLRRRLFGSATGAIADDKALEIARKASATLLLAGSVGVSEGKPFVTWRLVEVRSGSNLAARTVEGVDLMNVADQVVAGALPVLEKRMGVIDTTPPRAVTDMTTKSREALQHYLAGIQAWHEANDDLALDELKASVAIDSTFALAYMKMSEVAWRGDEQLTVEASARAWAHRTNLGLKDRMRLEASRSKWYDMSVYRELAARWPDDRDVLHDFSNALYQYGVGPDEAAEVARRGAVLYPRDTDFLVEEGRALDQAGRFREALQVDGRVIALEPSNPNNWDELGERYLALGLPDSAEAAFNRALQIDPSFFDSQRGLAWVAYCRGDVGKAIAMMEKLTGRKDLLPDLRAETQSFPGIMSLARLYAEAGQFSRALAVNQVSMTASFDRRSWYLSGNMAVARQALLLSMNDRGGAIAFNRSASKYFKNQVNVSWFNMDLYLAIDSLTAARRELEDAYYPNRYRWGPMGYQFLRYRKGCLLLREGEPDSALTYFRAVRWGWFVDARSHWGIAYRHELAHALVAAGRPDEAVEEMKDLVRVCGGHALGHYDLGKMYEKTGRNDDARREYTKFLEMWAHADEGLPPLIDARKRLKALGG